MKTAAFLVISLFLSGCGNVVNSRNLTTEQRLKNIGNELNRVGLGFSEKNELNTCLSLHKITCNNRVTALKSLIDEIVSSSGSEENMSAEHQQKVKASIVCIDLLEANIKDPTSPNCQH